MATRHPMSGPWPGVGAAAESLAGRQPPPQGRSPIREERRPMRTIVAGHEARSVEEFIELAIGTPVALWLGEEGESDEERSARMDAARDILADDPGLLDRTTRLAVETIGATMPDLLRLAPLAAVRSGGRRRDRAGVAA